MQPRTEVENDSVTMSKLISNENLSSIQNLTGAFIRGCKYSQKTRMVYVIMSKY